MSFDSTLSLLFEHIGQQTAPALWVLDEHGVNAPLPPLNAVIKVVSNRYDVVSLLQSKGWQAEFNDYDFTNIVAMSLENVFFRLAKEKAQVHHIINSAAVLLKPGGKLLLSGTKQQGIKTYAKSAERCLRGRCQIKKHGNDYLVEITRGSADAELLDDKQYHQLREISAVNGHAVYSKPGLYGWEKLDNGSRLLAGHLAELMRYKPPSTILDLGCGYGYLSIMAHYAYPNAHITATDNNAAALLAAKENMMQYAIEADVVADDCGGSLRARYKLIVCNPPFHQGFGVERDLTDLFVSNARRLCHKTGMAVFVVNGFIPIERIAQAYFAVVEVIDNDGKFKVVAMKP